MCRLMAYMGDPILLAHVVLWPDRSIIKQSYDAKERLSDPHLPQHLQFGNLNGDGFGIGCITPAWNNDNLMRLSSSITSSLMFAHVRAAYPGMPVSEQNCHPFQWGRYMWMHNGNVGGFSTIRRPMLQIMSDAAYNAVPSFHSDSSVAFGLFLHFLPDMEAKLSPDALLKAMEQVISKITDLSKEYGVQSVSLLNFVVSDGSTLIATRYVLPDGAKPASLYYAEGSSFQRVQKENGNSPHAIARTSSISAEGQYELTYAEQGSGVVLVASEPITGTASDWIAVPRNNVLTISREKSGYVNIMRTPLTASGTHPRQEEASTCLEAVGLGISTTARTWSSKLQDTSTSETNLTIIDKEDDRISGDLSAVLCLAIDSNGNRLFASSTHGSIRVWDLQTHTQVHSWHAHNEPVIQIVLNKGFLYTTGGHRLRIWDLKDYTCTFVTKLKPGVGTLRALAVGDGSIYVGGQDTSVKLFVINPQDIPLSQPKDGKMELWNKTPNNTGHLSVIHCLEICGQYICSGGGDAVIRVWNAETLSHVAALRGHRGSVLACKGYGCVLLSGGRDNTLRVWDLEELVCKRAMSGHKDDVLRIAMLCPGVLNLGQLMEKNQMRRSLSIAQSGGPCLVASCSADLTIRLWSMATWSCIRIFDLAKVQPPISIDKLQETSHHRLIPLSLALTQKQLYAGLRGGDVLLWHIEDVIHSIKKSYEARESFDNRDEEAIQNLSLDQATADSTAMELVKAAMELELEKSLEEFIKIRTISNNPLHREDCFKGAKFLARHLESMGAEVKLVRSGDDRNPVVIGRLGQKPSNPTITFYAHYDVQPADEADWNSDPFKVHSRDGYLYGRGTSDDKGPILAFIYAIKELEEMQTWRSKVEQMPVNFAFIFEGEEENGSKGTMQIIKENLHWFQNTLLTIISNTQWVGENIPCLTYGMRGMIALDICVSGPSKDLHSGNDGGVCNEPMVDLVKLLATLVDSQSNICVPGFYADAATTLLDVAWDGLQSSDEFSPDCYQSSLGIPGLVVAKSKQDILEARWCKPTLSVVDIRSVDTHVSMENNGEKDSSHYRFGPTRYSVIPRVAVGKISIRFVPRQDKDKIITCLTNHVKHEFAKLRSMNDVSVNVLTSGDWWEAKTESKYFKMAKNAILRVWGEAPLTVREGGTMPLASSLEKALEAEALLVPMGQASDNCHLANERIRRVNLMKGKEVVKNLLEEIITDVASS